MVGIYCIRNIVNDHRYIGQSIHLDTRKNEHWSALRKGIHFNRHLQFAFNEYGESNFIYEILEKCLEDSLSEREIFWIDKFGGYNSPNLYNLTPGGKSNFGEHNPRYGKHWSAEWRANQSRKIKEYLSDPTRHPRYGKKTSPETIEKNQKR